MGWGPRGADVTASQASWFGQPRGLTILFLTEMWEQFSYYGMRALLVYYMTKELMISQANASVQEGPASNWVRSSTRTPARQLRGALLSVIRTNSTETGSAAR